MRLASVCFLFLFSAFLYAAAEKDKDKEAFFMDAVIFKSEKPGQGRLDIYCVVPYGSLKFLNSSGRFASKFDISIEIKDKNGKIFDNRAAERVAIAKDMFESQGGSAKFDYSQHIFDVPPGDYDVTVHISDRLNNLYYERSRTVSVLDFDKFGFSASGLLLLSSVEEVNGKFRISPHISDNISDLKDGFFIFFETYAADSAGSGFDAIYEITEGDGSLVFTGARTKVSSRSQRQQHFIKIPAMDTLQPGSYILRLLLVNGSAGPAPSENDYLAISQRSIKKMSGFETRYFTDLSEGIRYLRYVATAEQADNIESAASEKEKRIRFEQFWRDMDPSPGSIHNEAFEEYYERVAYANRTFRLYTEGWLTDKGRIYIVMGPPLQAEATGGQMGNAQYERWIYPNNREFIFYDRTGFGEFRLERPTYFNEKYKFNKN